MAKKIEGFVYMNNIPTEGGNRLRDTTVTFFPAEDPNSAMTNKATLVICDERVFTESEVRAMVSEMVEGVTAGEELTLETIASKHGVSLDPAYHRDRR